MHDDLFATIARYRDPADAAEAQRALASAGIASELDGAGTLRVRNEDALRAGAVLDAECPWVGESETADDPPAPPVPCVCESCAPIRAERGASFAFVALMTVGFGLAFGASQAAFFALASAAVYFLITDRWRCAECGASWN